MQTGDLAISAVTNKCNEVMMTKKAEKRAERERNLNLCANKLLSCQMKSEIVVFFLSFIWYISCWIHRRLKRKVNHHGQREAKGKNVHSA